MKKYWILSISITVVLFFVVLVINHQYYGTQIDFYSGMTSCGLLTVLLVNNLIYAYRHRKEFRIGTSLLAGFSFLLQIIMVLFIVNGILWNTDTGAWNYYSTV